MDIAGYIASIFIGISSGLIGGGGSILTVPVLVYLFSLDAVLSTAYSLFIVGTTSVFGALENYRKGLVDFQKGFLFAIPSFIGVYLTRRFLVPIIPNEIITINSFTLTKGSFLMLFFALIMLFAAFSMLKKPFLMSNSG